MAIARLHQDIPTAHEHHHRREASRNCALSPDLYGTKNMTFKYSVTLPITGSHKIQRFTSWANKHAPGMEFRLPPQTPIKTETMTVRLKSLEDRQLVLQKLAEERL